MRKIFLFSVINKLNLSMKNLQSNKSIYEYKQEIMNFLDLIYKDASIYLNRKYNKKYLYIKNE